VSLTPGTRLGPYEIVSAIGAGGMGEVYKARDPRLNRIVALKLLPSSAANDPERRERFEREAQAVAALNHPGIVTIYSVEQADGQFFLTMELVEGQSLADSMPSTGWLLDRLLKIAIAVADAVAAAHQKGITHRDLKPANIMLGDGEHSGRVKVLDFGLAKLADASTSAAIEMPTALATKHITGEGRILGTVAYMSPEQAEGKPIDARSDLFSRARAASRGVRAELVRARGRRGCFGSRGIARRDSPRRAGPGREVVTLGELSERTVASERLVSDLTAVFGLLGVLVASLGLYGTIAYAVARRTNEIGVRLALGESPSGVRWMIVKETLALVAAGAAAGVALMLPLANLLASVLFGVSGRDPRTLLLSAVTVMLGGLVAGAVPAWRPSRVNPTSALRAD
jgi:tRNA A-37 threonylcarbamoyl transferase component Bud32